MDQTVAYRKHYALGDWEGGLAVYVTRGDHGTKIVSIPRLGLSTALTGYYDESAISDMLMKNRSMYNNPKEMDHFADLILRDVRNIPVVQEPRNKRGKPSQAV